MPTLEISLDWAKSGSWEDYQVELDRVLKQADAPVLDSAAPAVGGPAAAATATPPPAPGILDKVKGWGTDAANSVGSMWNGMPTWGRGALIGGGIGALGGMLSDKRKGRGAMQGALLGAGLGAGAGYLYNQYGGGTGTTSGGGGGASGEGVAPTKTLAQHVADGAKSLTSAANSATGNSSLLAGGSLVGGHYLNQSGKQNVEIAGATNAQGERYPGRPTVVAAPTNDIAMKTLQSNQGGELNRALESLAAGKPGTGASAYRIPQEALATNPQLAAIAQKNVENYLAKQPLPEIDPNAFDKLVGGLNPNNQTPAHQVRLANGEMITIPHQELTSTMGANGPTPIAVNAANPLANRNELLANAQRYLNQNYQRPTVTPDALLGQLKNLQPGGVAQFGGTNVPVDSILDASGHTDPVKQMVEKLTAQHTAQNPTSAATPKQIEDALFKLKTQQGGPLDLQIGNKTISPTHNDLIAEHGRQLQAGHQRQLEPVDVVNRRLGLRRLGGKGLMALGGAGLADQIMEGFSPSKADFVSRVGSLPGTPAGIEQAVNQTDGLSSANITEGLKRLKWTPEQQQQFLEALARKNSR